LSSCEAIDRKSSRLDRGLKVGEELVPLDLGFVPLRDAIAAQLCLSDFSRDRRSQPHGPAFGEIIVGPRFHHLDGHVFADAARHDDERNIEAAGLK
jgi:hypothetical protein